MHEGATPKRVAAMRDRGLYCGRVVAGVRPRENPDENATCATERFAQVDIPSDSAPAICTGRNSVRFCLRWCAVGAIRRKILTKMRVVQLKDLHRSKFHPITCPAICTGRFSVRFRAPRFARAVFRPVSRVHRAAICGKVVFRMTPSRGVAGDAVIEPRCGRARVESLATGCESWLALESILFVCNKSSVQRTTSSRWPSNRYLESGHVLTQVGFRQPRRTEGTHGRPRCAEMAYPEGMTVPPHKVPPAAKDRRHAREASLRGAADPEGTAVPP